MHQVTWIFLQFWDFQVTAKAKEDAWREIQHELEEMGADSFKVKKEDKKI